MAVENRIVKVQKRNRALVRFDHARIRDAILRAAESIGGFAHDQHAGINQKIFQSCGSDVAIADFLQTLSMRGIFVAPQGSRGSNPIVLRRSSAELRPRMDIDGFDASVRGVVSPGKVLAARGARGVSCRR